MKLYATVGKFQKYSCGAPELAHDRIYCKEKQTIMLIPSPLDLELHSKSIFNPHGRVKCLEYYTNL